MKALKFSVLAVCYLIVVVRTASAEEKGPASATSGRAANPTKPVQDVREAATRAVRLIDRTSAEFLTKRACFTCHTQMLSAMVLLERVFKPQCWQRKVTSGSMLAPFSPGNCAVATCLNSFGRMAE